MKKTYIKGLIVEFMKLNSSDEKPQESNKKPAPAQVSQSSKKENRTAPKFHSMRVDPKRALDSTKHRAQNNAMQATNSQRISKDLQ